jgi:hypothetical protein
LRENATASVPQVRLKIKKNPAWRGCIAESAERSRVRQCAQKLRNEPEINRDIHTTVEIYGTASRDSANSVSRKEAACFASDCITA